MNTHRDTTATRTTSPTARTLSRRRLIVGLAVAPAVAALLVACGDTTQQTADTVAPPSGPGTSVVPPATEVPATDTPATVTPGTDTPATGVGSGIEYPHDAGTAVIRVESEGGFVPPGVDVRELPRA